MVWGGPAVPTLPVGLLVVLMLGCFLAGGFFLRPGRRGPRSALAAALLFLLPLSVTALTLPHVFANGTIADADEVNADFEAITSALDVESCPAGMTRIDLPRSILCYAAGPAATWDQAYAYCSDQFRARLCDVQQWRDAICQAGLPSPGASWTDSITGSAAAGVVASCSAESFGSAPYTAQRAAACCVERPRY